MKKFIAILALFTASSAFAGSMYVGATAGYLTDSEEGLYTAQVGYTFAQSAKLANSVEFEAGYTSDTEYGIKGDIVPLLVNYRGIAPLGEGPISLYFGAGLGMSNVKVSYYYLSDSDWSFTYQAFAGVQFKASEAVALRLGARYIDINEVRLYNTNVDVGDDLAIEGGVSFKF